MDGTMIVWGFLNLFLFFFKDIFFLINMNDPLVLQYLGEGSSEDLTESNGVQGIQVSGTWELNQIRTNTNWITQPHTNQVLWDWIMWVEPVL